MFCKIVADIDSGDPARERRGYIDYHEMHRHFMKGVWEPVADNVDRYREHSNRKGLRALVEEFGGEMCRNRPSQPDPRSSLPACLPPLGGLAAPEKPIEGEQYSLF